MPLCNQYLDTNRDSCPTSWLCYSFQTWNNSSLCAPQVLCSTLESCINDKKCQVGSSVCVVNSCCSTPVCMPLALSNLCTVTANIAVGRVCSSATWQQNSTTYFQDVWHNYLHSHDFFLDSDNNIIMSEYCDNRIVKYSGKNNTIATLLANGNSTYYMEAMFVHPSGVIYTVESRYNYSSYERLYRFQRYTNVDGLAGTTLFGDTSCGTAANQICGCRSLFVDTQGGIYCSDSQNHRVVKIIPYTSTIIIIAGSINGSMGYGTNELYYPSSIFVDQSGNLIVLDSGNSRLLKFSPGNRNGTILFSPYSYSWGSYMYVDAFGIVYYTSYSGIYRWVPGATYPTMIIGGSSFSTLRFDAYGNLYTIDNSKNTIEKYNIFTNNC
ncbi:unnamed protein product [Adineta steineri]|uniref:NHL repeat containing protein n=2 Tax=Adineta steineri TaxID=433720 RepID=A0A814TGU2_9BILA|nr:unnamed protein product [Adineta steineri]CAF4030238.1 unnamed protein product [Adineta steineri]